jgi:hypothetical protein
MSDVDPRFFPTYKIIIRVLFLKSVSQTENKMQGNLDQMKNETSDLRRFDLNLI